jgi:hypothetical protein
MACGHVSSSADAERLLNDVDLHLYRVAVNAAQGTEQGSLRGEPLTSYDGEDGRVAFTEPARLLEAFRANSAAMKAIRDRHTRGQEDGTLCRREMGRRE